VIKLRNRNADPSYERVCRHRTGHAEAVEVWFDPAQVSYVELLQKFWPIHKLRRRVTDLAT
jgi:peptide methionine sulfoxide reductase MsrA